MNLFNDILAQDMAMVFGDGDGFAEKLTYTFGISGVQFTFPAVVFRNVVSPVKGPTGQKSPATSIQVQIPYSTDPAVGIPVPPRVTADKIKLSDQSAGGISATDHSITQILSQDAGGWLLELR